MKCPYCGNTLNDGDLFCVNCGKEVPAVRMQTCIQCGAHLEPGSQFCGECGCMVASSFTPAVQGLPSNNERCGKSKPDARMIVAVSVAVVAVILVIVLAVVLLANGSSGQNDTSEQAVEEAPSQNEPLNEGDGGTVSSQEASDDTAVKVKDSLSDYSWAELAKIAEEIERDASTKSSALSIAAKYNLVESDGTLTGDPKPLSTADGTVDVFIVDVYQDDMENGKKAAFTFMTWQIVTRHPMNSSASNSGGWKTSGMRSWLNSSVLKGLPTELQGSIVSVNKLTNNEGKTQTPSSVSATKDKLWLFSWKECLGDISWNQNADTHYIDVVDNAEGSQYLWFSQQGVAGKQGHVSLDRSLVGSSGSDVWWMRSSAPNTDTSFGDMGPEIDNGGTASTAEGVVFGFCL